MAKGRKTGGRVKGSKNKSTIEKEERRKIFDEKVAKKWEPIIDDLIEKEKKYVANQFIGKAQERIDITSKGKPIPFLPKELTQNNALPDNNGTGEDSETEEKNQGDSGRNGSEQNNLNPPASD